jgi:hypothetical protein
MLNSQANNLGARTVISMNRLTHIDRRSPRH